MINVPEEERTCDCCGKSFKCVGEERSEQLHFRPIEFYVVVQVLLKYLAACDCSARRSATAESPIKTIDKGIASTSVVAAIAVMKYADHLPLARQATQVFKRSGLELSQSSMCRWMDKAAYMLEPLYDLICELILLSYCLGIDATNVKYREPAVGYLALRIAFEFFDQLVDFFLNQRLVPNIVLLCQEKIIII